MNYCPAVLITVLQTLSSGCLCCGMVFSKSWAFCGSYVFNLSTSCSHSFLILFTERKEETDILFPSVSSLKLLWSLGNHPAFSNWKEQIQGCKTSRKQNYCQRPQINMLHSCATTVHACVCWGKWFGFAWCWRCHLKYLRSSSNNIQFGQFFLWRTWTGCCLCIRLYHAS